MLKLLKALLQGKWMKHPLHPALVHVPTALWPAALVFDCLAAGGIGGPTLLRASYYMILAGLVVALLAVPSGLADWSDIRREKPAWKLALYHMLLNVVATGLWGANFWLRYQAQQQDSPALPSGALVLSLAGTLVLMFSGYLGGRMVYEHGIGVARDSKHQWRKIAQAGHANLPPEKA